MAASICSRKATVTSTAFITHRECQPVSYTHLDVYKRQGQTVGDLIADDKLVDPDELLQSCEVSKLLTSWLEQLGEKQRQVLQRRYGLGGIETSTLEQIAADLNLTRERVRQIQAEAIDRLRRIIRRGGVTSDQLL